MVKQKIQHQCNACGAVSGKWTGCCSGCGEWDTIEEMTTGQFFSPAGGGNPVGYAGSKAEMRLMSEVKLDTLPRLLTGLAELDRVLGGGLVQGSVVLVGGDPGVGKSTALLQVSLSLKDTKTLYVTGEESLQQIAMRAERLGMSGRGQDLMMLAETQVEKICEAAVLNKAQVMVIDSIQTMQVSGVQSAPGGVSQVRESAAYLTRFAKHSGVSVFLVGHVTKSGGLAGPRVLEHIIDVVCYLESSSDARFRIMRAIKNRYGAVNELGVFAMTEKGLVEVRNPSAIFLTRLKDPMPGSAVMVVWEGSRPLLVEIQALVDRSYSDHPRRVTLGLDLNRLSMLLAVLHRHGGVATYDKDVFVNVVGGVKVVETGVDLALIMAIFSSLHDMPLPDELVVFGEIGLAGEIRPVPNGQDRLQEAVKHGFKKAIVPRANVAKAKVKGMEVHGVERLSEAIAICKSF